MGQYTDIINGNLQQFYAASAMDADKRLPATREGDTFLFRAFGSDCRVTPDGIWLDNARQEAAVGIILSLYALNAPDETCRIEPLKAFREFPDSMPYVGAFATHTEQILVPHVGAIQTARERVIARFSGEAPPPSISGDFAFVIYPLPRIALCYIFYLADDDFPASVTCLYSANAGQFLSVDALADVGEYTSRKIIDGLP